MRHARAQWSSLHYVRRTASIHTPDPGVSSTPVPMASAYGKDSASARGALNLGMVIRTNGKPVTVTSRTY
jgi:hypothetical protein